MNLQPSKCMKLAFRRYIGGAGCFLGRKYSKMLVTAVYCDLRTPFHSELTDAKWEILGFPFRLPEILQILCARRFSQIVESIIRAITIDMIDIVSWPSSCHIEPCQPIGIVKLAVNAYHRSSMTVLHAGDSRSLYTIPDNEPFKDSGFRIVVKKLFESFSRDLLPIHAVDYIRP